MHVFCIVLSLISIFYFSIHVIFSYSAFRLQECSIKSVSQSVSQSIGASNTAVEPTAGRRNVPLQAPYSCSIYDHRVGSE